MAALNEQVWYHSSIQAAFFTYADHKATGTRRLSIKELAGGLRRQQAGGSLGPSLADHCLRLL